MFKDDKGYVTPIPVNELEKDMELNEQQVKETNNSINYKKKSVLGVFIPAVITILIVFVIAFYAIKFSKNFIEKGNPTSTTQTTVNHLDKSYDYFNKDIVRRYELSNKIYLFLPRSLSDNVYEITHDKNGVTNTQLGTYDNEHMYLTMDETIDYSVSEEGLTMDDLQAKMSVGEFKYYKGDNSILVVNASENALQGLYMNNGNVIEGSYMEYDDRIEIKGSTQVYVFNKSGNDVMYNGVKLTLQI